MLPAALPLALLFAAIGGGGGGTVTRDGGLRERKFLFRGCAAGTALALVFAVLRRTTAINAGIITTGILSIAVAAGAVFLAVFWRPGRSSRVFLAAPVHASAAAAVLAGALLAAALPALFLLPAEFVLAGQSVFSTDFLANLAGAALGLALVIYVCYALFCAGASAGGRLHALIFSALLLLTLVNYAAEIARFLMARRIIPLRRGLFTVIMAIVNNQQVFLFAGIGLAALSALIPLFAKTAAAPVPGPVHSGLNPAEIRKQKAARRRYRRYCGTALVFLGLGVFALTGLKAWDRREIALSPPEPFMLEGAEIRIPVDRIEDGRLHRFAWNASDTTEVRFIVIKKSVSAWGVGLDACDICGNTGYYERRDGVICKLCDVVMNKSTIGFKGGCNPVPLAYSVRDGAMIVRTDDLENEKGRFK